MHRTRLLHKLSKCVLALGLASVAASAATFVQGYLTYEYYPGKVRDDVTAGTAGTPSTEGAVVGSDKSGYIASFESGTNFADNYANRVYGYFVPPATGDYVFFIAGDDDSDLFLSTDATAANKQLIAQEAGWSAVRSYVTIGGTSLAEDKRSDTSAVSTWPSGGKITLTKGQKYYIEAVHHEGGGGDNLAVTYKLATEADPKNGDAPRLAGAVIGTDVAAAPAAPNISITAQPIGGTFYDTGNMTLAVGVQSDSPFPVGYQWRKDGQPITGATGPTYSVSGPTSANAGSYDVQVSVPGADGNPVVVTSTPAVVTVKTPQVGLETGKLKYEYFPGSDRTTVEAGGGSASYAGATVGSDNSGFVTILESGTNFAEGYANRFSGLFIPDTTGNYVFYIAGDDDSDLFLSTDETPANKKLIAQEAGWSGVRIYNNIGGGSTVEGKRSDQFPDTQWPDGNTISLTKGKRYYIEAVHHEGGGGDNLAVTYRLDTEDETTVTADGTAPRLTGNVIGVLVPRVIAVATSSPTPSSLGFSITDADPSILDPASVKVTFDGKAVTATPGTKANGLSPFTYTYPALLAQGSTHTFTIQANDTQGQSITSTGTYTVPYQWWPKDNLQGPAVVDKKWASRFIFGVTDPNGNLVTITGLQNIFKILAESGKTSFTDGTNTKFTGSVVDVTPDVINWNTGGHFGGDNPYPDDAINGAGWTGENFINLNIANLDIPEEADYTFAVHSDDGFSMRIRGGKVVKVSGNGQADPVDPEAVVHPGDTGDSSTRAVYHLRKGVYRIEFFWWENGGGDNGEIYAAKGNFANDGDTSTWKLIGDPTPAQTLTLLGVDDNGWTVISSDPGGDTLATWADAQADLAATGGSPKKYDYLNVGDQDTNGGVLPAPKDVAGVAEDNYALKATATLVVPQDGTYLLGFNSDDGAYMKIAGKTFLEIQQNNTGLSVIDGDSVTCECLTGDSGTTATVTLTKGNYPIEFGMFEQGGGSFLAAHGVLLPANPITTGDMPFLAKGAAGTTVQTASALQLTNKAADGGGPDTGGTPTATITVSGGNVTITSSNGGTVQATDSLSAPNWQDVGAAPQTVPTSGKAARFFRLKK